MADASLGKAVLRTQVDTTGLKSGLDAAERQIATFGAQAGRNLQDIGRTITGIGTSFTARLTLPIVGAGVAIVKTAADFERSLNRVAALSGATGDSFEKLREQAKELGATTQFSASQAADAMSFLAQAGFNAEQIFTSLPATLNLAGAAQLDLAQSADIVSNILTGFQLPVDQLDRAVDVLTKSFTSANTDLSQLGQGFKFVGPVASSFGLSLEETAAALGLLSNAGIQASSAGTGLRRILTTLATEQEKLGVSTLDAQGKLRPLGDILEDIERRGLSATDVMEIFGDRGGPALNALLSQGSDALEALTGRLEDSAGAAERIQEVQLQGLVGELTQLKSAAEGLAIAFGDTGLLTGVTRLVTGATDLVRSFSELNPAAQTAIVAVAGVAAAIGPALVVIGNIVSSVGTLIVALPKAAAGFTALKVALAGALGPAGLIVVGAVGVAALVKALTSGANDRAGLEGASKAASQALAGGSRESLIGALDEVIAKADGPAKASLQGLRDGLVFTSDISGVVESLDGIIAKAEGDTKDALEELSEQLKLDSDPTKALQALDQIIAKADGDVAQSLFLLRERLVQSADVSAVIASFDEIIEMADGETRIALEDLAERLEFEGDSSGVLNALDEIISKVDGDLAQALFRFRADLIQTGDTGVLAASRIAAALIQANPEQFGIQENAFGSFAPIRVAFEAAGVAFSDLETALSSGNFVDAIAAASTVAARLEGNLNATAQDLAAEVREFITVLQQASTDALNRSTGEFRAPPPQTNPPPPTGDPPPDGNTFTGGDTPRTAADVVREAGEAGAALNRMAALIGTAEAQIAAAEGRFGILERAIVEIVTDFPESIGTYYEGLRERQATAVAELRALEASAQGALISDIAELAPDDTPLSQADRARASELLGKISGVWLERAYEVAEDTIEEAADANFGRSAASFNRLAAARERLEEAIVAGLDLAAFGAGVDFRARVNQGVIGRGVGEFPTGEAQAASEEFVRTQRNGVGALTDAERALRLFEIAVDAAAEANQRAAAFESRGIIGRGLNTPGATPFRPVVNPFGDPTGRQPGARDDSTGDPGVKEDADKFAQAAARAAEEQREAGKQFALTVINSASTFANAITAFARGDIGAGITGIGGGIGSIVSAIPGQQLTGAIIGAVAGLFGGLVSAGQSQREQDRARASGASARGAPAIEFNVNVQQSLNVQSLTDPASRAAVDGLLNETVNRITRVIEQNLIPRVSRLEAAVL